MEETGFLNSLLYKKMLSHGDGGGAHDHEAVRQLMPGPATGPRQLFAGVRLPV